MCVCLSLTANTKREVLLGQLSRCGCWLVRTFLDLLIFDISNLDKILNLSKYHVTNLLVGTLEIFKWSIMHYSPIGNIFQVKH